jgi:serine/threonine protein kinase
VAPEVLAGQQYDESVDVYSLGVILSEVDTHTLPFDDRSDDGGQEPLTDSAIAGMIVTGALKVTVTQSCPSSIRSLVQRSTAFKPQQRPSVFQVADELRAVLDYSTSRGGVPCS